jgi:hypothetical protein
LSASISHSAASGPTLASNRPLGDWRLPSKPPRKLQERRQRHPRQPPSNLPPERPRSVSWCRALSTSSRALKERPPNVPPHRPESRPRPITDRPAGGRLSLDGRNRVDRLESRLLRHPFMADTALWGCMDPVAPAHCPAGLAGLWLGSAGLRGLGGWLPQL